MRLAESSNTHYLLPGAVGPEATKHSEIIASVNTYYELKPTVPRVVKLRGLLHKRTYDGLDTASADGGDTHAAKRLTTDALRAAVQCSDAELHAALNATHAVELRGEWRMLGIGYRHNITESIIKLVEEHGWPLDGVPVATVLARVAEDSPDLPGAAVFHCLSCLCAQPLGPADAEAVDATCALELRQMAIFHAENMLREQPLWQTEDFLEGWAAVAPEGLDLSLRMLGDIAIEVELEVEGQTQPAMHVQWLPRARLPASISERLESLIKVKAAWKLEEITSYLDELLEVVIDQSKEQILIQYARQMKTDEDESVFIRRI
ncbi:sister chromatid cohesion protein Dcc1 [Pavlovales sp. CCMP2436]|nr:sister chromatid cohesion protein Dcc1 [Pavlovales sp. CCMP2436]